MLFLSSLATLYTEGSVDVPKNRRIAFSLASFGVRRRCPHCIGVLARCFLAGYGCQENLKVAKYLAKKSAATGSCCGYFVLGYLAYEQMHLYLAKKYWQKAAYQGMAAAQVNLGSLLVKESLELRKAIASDEEETCSELIVLEIVWLEREALQLFSDASQKGHPIGWQELGLMYYQGLGVAHDRSKASECFSKSKKAGNTNLLLV